MRHDSPMEAVPDIHPNRSLGLLSIAHAINHAQAVLLPLIFLKIIDEFGVGVEAVAFLAAIGSFASGLVQLSYAALTRVVSRRGDMDTIGEALAQPASQQQETEVVA